MSDKYPTMTTSESCPCGSTFTWTGELSVWGAVGRLVHTEWRQTHVIHLPAQTVDFLEPGQLSKEDQYRRILQEWSQVIPNLQESD